VLPEQRTAPADLVQPLGLPGEVCGGLE
jgi:hypothetical protein